MAPPKALENIGETLHSQYERWQPKVTKLPMCLTLWYFGNHYLQLHVLNSDMCRLVTSFSWILQWRKLKNFAILAASMPDQRESFSIIMDMVYQSLPLMVRFGCLTR